MAVKKLSQITQAGAPPAHNDFVVGVSAAGADLLYTIDQVASGILTAGTATSPGVLWDNSGTVDSFGNWNNASAILTLGTGAATLAGGNGASSSLVLESTTGAGTSDFIDFLTGSQARAGRFDTNGNLGVGVIPSHVLDLKAGTSSFASIRMASGTVLTSPAAGAVEYDGTVMYGTPVVSNRGVINSEHFLSLTGNQNGSNVATVQSWFPGGGATTITLPASTSYFLEGKLVMLRTAGTTAHTISVGFGGTAGITSVQYTAFVSDLNSGGPGLTTPQVTDINVVSQQILSASSANANQWTMFYIRGIIRISTTGTLIPQFQYSSAPGGAPSIQGNSFFRMVPIGNNNVSSVGNWS